MTRARAGVIGLGLVALLSGEARADEESPMRMRSAAMVGVGVGTIVLACGQEVGFGVLAAFGDAVDHQGCGCLMCKCGGGGDLLMGWAVAGLLSGGAALVGGIVLIAIGAKRVPAETSALRFDPRGLVVTF